MDKAKLAYSLAEASQATSLSRRSLEYLIERGRLDAVKVNRRLIIPSDSLRKLVEGRSAVKTNQQPQK